MKTNLSTIGLCIATGFAIAAVIEIGISSKETTVDAVVAINNATELNNFIKKNKKSVTEFYAPWCGFCKGMESSYREMAQKNSGVKFAKVDCTTDGGKKLAQDYKIGGFPTFAIFKDGKHTDTVVGANKPELEKKVKLIAA